jgi:hypothetical protein
MQNTSGYSGLEVAFKKRSTVVFAEELYREPHELNAIRAPERPRLQP